jgi:hypothetical protein
MLALYRLLLHLYPAEYRCEFGEEMLDVLSEVEAGRRRRNKLARALASAHEAGGLLHGAMREHLWSITGSQGRRRLSPMFTPRFLSRRSTMRSEFRFPKATVALMTVILTAIIFTIEKAKALSASIPHANPPVGHIQPVEFTIVPSLLVALISALVVGVAGWAALFALRRSGIQRISGMNASAGQRAGT